MLRIPLISALLALPVAAQVVPFFTPVMLRPGIPGTQYTHMTDVDGDGRTDLLYSRDYSLDRKIEFQRGLGGNQFGPAEVIDADFYDVATLEVADLNGDGRPDVAAGTGSDTGGIRIYLNGGGNFAESQRMTGFYTYSLQLSDLDGDGDADLVYRSTAAGVHTVKWRPNDGTGAFGAERAVSSVAALRLRCVDIDRDGDRDVVAMQNTSNSIAWYPNNGSGTFGSARSIESGLGSQIEWDLADADNDNDVDLTVMAGSQVYLYRNNGTGTFSRNSLFSPSGSMDLIKFVKADGDALPDLVYEANSSVFYRRNLGGGSFGAAQSFVFPTTSWIVSEILVTDYDRDGLEDLISTGWSGGSIHFHRNGSASPPNIVSFGAADNTVAAGTSATIAWTVEGATTVRIDGTVVTGTSLSVTPGTKDKTYTLTATNASGTSTARTTVFVPDTVFADQAALVTHSAGFPTIDAADINGDGKPDIACVLTSFTDEIVWYPAGASMTFGTKRVVTNSLDDPRGLLLADIDKDGDADLLAGHFSGANLYRNNGSGTFSAPVSLSNVRTSGFKTADMNGDGWPDLVLFDRSSNGLRVALNDGSGNFPGAVDAVSGSSYDVIVADVDKDGILDLLLMSEGGTRLCRGITPTTFKPSESLGSTSTGGLAYSDLNGDGFGDLLNEGGTANSDTVRILPGLPAGFFGPATYVRISNLSSFTTGDFDGDLDLDVGFVTPQSSSPRNAGWLEGDGFGRFSEPFTAAAGPVDSYQVLARDMDADGDLDLLASASGRVVWMRNVTEHATPPAIDRFASTYPVLHRGESVELQWDVTGDPVITITPGVGTVTGNRITVTPSQTTTYTISATNRNGTVTREITVTVVDRPVIHSFTTNLDGADRTTPVTLSWNVAGATSLSISPGIGTVSGNSITLPLDRTTTFTLTATNASGTDTLDLTVAVNPNLFRYRGHLPLTGDLDSGITTSTADLNRDGRADIVCATGTNSGTSGGALFWMQANANGTFSANRTIRASTQRTAYDHVVADFDNDGWLDVAAVNIGSTGVTARLELHRNTGSGASWQETVIEDATPTFDRVEAGDLDGDGRTDLVTLSSGLGSLFWYRNLGNGSFAARVQIALNVAGTTKLRVADLDRDGDNDLVASVAETGPGVVWFANAGNGTFGPRTTLIAIGQVRDFDLGDLDGDGDHDIALANRSDNSFYVYLNGGSLRYGNRAKIGTGGNTFRMFTDIEDVDSDGDLDVVHGELYTNWSENRGNGVFDTRLMEFDPVVYLDLAAGDFNGDGDLDYAIVRLADNQPVGWLENLSTPPAAAPRILAFGAGGTTAVLPGTRLDLRWTVAGFPTSVTVTPTSRLAPLDLRQRSLSITGGPTETEMVQSYEITATNAAGTSTATFNLRVGNPPDLRAFTHGPSLVNQGDPVDLSWDIGRADTITIAGAGDFTGQSGARLIPGVAPFTRYVLTATNAFGSRQAQTDVEVNRPPSATALPAFTANPAADPLDLAAAPAFSDPDSGDRLSWSITGNTLPAIFSELAIDPATGRLRATFPPHIDGESVLTLRGTDRNGLHAETTLLVTLPRVPDPALSVTGEISLNRQTGLHEQTLRVTNSGGRAIGGFLIEIAGLPEGVTVRDAPAPEAGRPYLLVFHQPVAAGATVEVRVEYLSKRRGGIGFTPQINVIQVAAPEAVAVPEGDAFQIDRLLRLPDGAFLLEWPSTPGRRYQVQYTQGSDPWVTSPASITASSDRIQWIDQGPPKTLVHPSAAPTRLYRVIEIDAP